MQRITRHLKFALHRAQTSPFSLFVDGGDILSLDEWTNGVSHSKVRKHSCPSLIFRRLIYPGDSITYLSGQHKQCTRCSSVITTCHNNNTHLEKRGSASYFTSLQFVLYSGHSHIHNHNYNYSDSQFHCTLIPTLASFFFLQSGPHSLPSHEIPFFLRVSTGTNSNSMT